MLSTDESLLKELVSFLMPVMVESGSGYPINAINFIPSTFLGKYFFVQLTLYQYALKRGQLYIDFHLNIIHSGELSNFQIIYIYIYRQQVDSNTLIGCRYLFGVIVNTFPLELLMFSKPFTFMVGGTNIYGGIFIKFTSSHHSLFPLFLILVLWNYCDVVIGFCITSTCL